MPATLPLCSPAKSQSRYRQALAQRIRKVFEDRADEVLFADRRYRLTGHQCLERLEVLDHELAIMAPKSATVGVLIPPSVTQGFAITACLALEYVPLVLDPWPTRPPAGAGVSLHALLTTVDAPRLLDTPPSLLLDPQHSKVERHDPADTSQSSPSTPSSVMPALLPPAAGLVLRTSGSSGKPREVILSAEGLVYIIDFLIQHFSLDHDSVAAVSLPLHHTMGLNTQFLPCFLAGGRSIFFPAGLRLGHLYRDLLDTEATFVAMVSDMIRLCLDEKKRRRLPPALSVREMQLAGGQILPEHLEMARELFPEARIHKGYGLTEAIRVSMITSDDPAFMAGSAGRAITGQDVEIRDSSGKVMPTEKLGEIHVRGPNVMLGYGEGPSPISADGFLATGDLGHLTPDGQVVISGRRDRIFKSYGHRIAAPEIEATVRSLDDVAAAWCIAVPCRVRGHRPVLFLELTQAGIARFDQGGREMIEGSLIRSLEPYKVPKDIVILEIIPTLSVGKVDFSALADLWQVSSRRKTLGQGPAGCRFLRLLAKATEQQQGESS